MTRGEKEKAVLMVLGLNVGDVVNTSYFNFKIKFRIVEHYDHYALERIEKGVYVSPSSIYIPITDLVKYDFVKVQTLGSMVCRDMDCEQCPFWENVTCLGGIGATLYEVLEISKSHNVVTNEKYEELKKELDKEVNENVEKD